MEMKLSITLALILSSIAGVTAANAAEPVGGWYLGGSVGAATTDGNTNISGLTMTDKTDTALSLRAGYRLHANWAVEAGYVDLGKSKYRSTGSPDGTIKTNVWHVDAVGILPLADKFAVFGKLGVAQMNYDDSGDKTNKSAPHLGLGVSYVLTPAIALRAEYDDYGKVSFGSGSNSTDLRSHQFSLGMDYRF